MNAVICGEPIEGRQQQAQPSHLAQYHSECQNNVRGVPNRSTYGGLNATLILEHTILGDCIVASQVLNQMIRLTGMPRWYIKRQAARWDSPAHGSHALDSRG